MNSNAASFVSTPVTSQGALWEPDPLTSWMVHQCASLDDLLYSPGNDWVEAVRTLPKVAEFTITKVSGTDEHLRRDRILFVEGNDNSNGDTCVIVAFRTSDWHSLVKLMKEVNEYPRRDPGVGQPPDESVRGQLVRLDYLFSLIQLKCRLILTGHSVGGACASLLAARLLIKYGSIDSHFHCVTFGSPLCVGNRLIGLLSAQSQNMFVNYLLDQDEAPMRYQDGSSPTIGSESFSTVPCGSYWKLNRDKNGIFSYRLESSAVVQELFMRGRRAASTLQPTEDLASEHEMHNYAVGCASSGVLTDRGGAAPEVIGDYTNTQFPPAAPTPAPRLLIIRDKTVVELIGENLSLVIQFAAQENSMTIVAASATSLTLFASVRVVAELSEEYAGGMAFVTMQDVVGHTFRGAIPIEMCFADLNHVLPNELISAITPLTHLLDISSLEVGSAVAEHLQELNEQCSHMIGDTIPIEFAFNIMTKEFSSGGADVAETANEIPNSALHTRTDLQWTGNRPIDPRAEARKYLVVFLTKLAALEIRHDDWEQYSSYYMIEVIMKSIANLQNQSEESIAELESLFYKAIKEDTHRLKRYRFPQIASTRCKYSGDIFFVTAPASGQGTFDLPRCRTAFVQKNVDDAVFSYWSLICHEKISAGIIFADHFPTTSPPDQYKPILVPGQGAYSHTYFRITCTSFPEAALEDTKGWIYGGSKKVIDRVKIAKYSIKQIVDEHFSKDGIPATYSPADLPRIAALASGEMVSDGPQRPEDELIFTQFVFSCQQSTPETEASTLMKVITSCSSVVNSETQAIHVQSAEKHFDYAFALLMLWILEERRKDHKDITENAIAKVFKSIKDDLNKSGTLLVQDSASLRLRGVVDKVFPKNKSNASAHVRNAFSNTSIYNAMRSIGARKNNPRKRVISMLRELSHRMITNYHIASRKYFCGLAVNVLKLHNFFAQHNVATKAVPDVTIVHYATAESLVAHKEIMIENANHVSYEVRFLTIMMDDLMEMSLGNVIDIARTSSVDIGLQAVRAMGQLVLLGGQWVFAQMQSVWGDNTTASLEVSRHISSVLESVRHRSENFKTYKGLLDMIIFQARIELPAGSKYNTLAGMEEEIFNRLPGIVKHLDLQTLVALAANGDFANTPFSALFQSPRSISVLMVFFKLIVHAHALKFKRREFKIVTIAGQKNAGKTTLAIKLLGADVVQAIPGDNIENTTVFPKAYPYAADPSLTFIDLPGCTDECTAGISSMFASSSDISIFLINQKEPKKNSNSLLEQTLRLCLDKRRGACLVCINGYDRNIKGDSMTREKAIQKLRSEALEWTSEKFRAAQDNEYEAGLEEIRSGAAPFDNSRHGGVTPIPPVEAVRPRPIKHWEAEKSKLNCVVYSTGVVAHKPLSVWLTAFDPLFHAETLTKELIFSSEDVKLWINEVKLHQYTS